MKILRIFGVAALLFVVLVWQLGTPSFWDPDEAYYAEASREMRQSGDFLVPSLNGDYRFDKPPLIYWCQVLSYNVFGENDFAARFPSAYFLSASSDDVVT